MQIVPNIVEPNGKTVKQNNLEQGHKIPLKTLVEVNIPYSDHHGIRMFVCDHTRDCDGTPLYALATSNELDNLAYIKETNPLLYRYMITDGFSDECLKIVEPLA